MKNVETRRKLNNLKKALLIAGLATGITACAKTGSNEEVNKQNLTVAYDYEYLVPSGYALTQDENGEYIGVAYINGERVTVEAQKFLKATYCVPEGYTLGKDSEGNYIAIKDSVSENDKEEKQKIR